MDAAGRQFGSIARTYHGARPPVPTEAVEWLTDPPEGHPYQEVLDLGAGTGRFTAQLLHWIPIVHAIEPDTRMLTVLRRTYPLAVGTLGVAEALPMPAACVDAVFAAGSWHWFEPEAATAEIVRVLRPGGRLGAVWNIRNPSVPWVRELHDLIGHQHQPGREPGMFALPEGAPFGPLEQRVFSWHWDVSPDDLVLSLGTYSYVLTKTPEERAALLGKVECFLTEHGELVEDGVIRVPIRTVCWRTQLTP